MLPGTVFPPHPLITFLYRIITSQLCTHKRKNVWNQPENYSSCQCITHWFLNHSIFTIWCFKSILSTLNKLCKAVAQTNSVEAPLQHQTRLGTPISLSAHQHSPNTFKSWYLSASLKEVCKCATVLEGEGYHLHKVNSELKEVTRKKKVGVSTAWTSEKAGMLLKSNSKSLLVWRLPSARRCPTPIHQSENQKDQTSGVNSFWKSLLRLLAPISVALWYLALPAYNMRTLNFWFTATDLVA